MKTLFRQSVPAAAAGTVSAVVTVFSLIGAAIGQDASKRPDVPFVPTPEPVVERMLEIADIKPGDFLIDLGSGDGRIAITAAAKHGIEAMGVDIDPVRVQEARQNAAKQKVSDKVEFRQQDLFETDLGDADVVTMYLLQDVNMKLKPRLMQLPPGTRIVSHAFDLGDWKPDRTETVAGRTIYLWTVGREQSASPAQPQLR